ncbi:atherin isoform X1 [Triticum aestivum]|uniref:atherin isoform X1 n=1 Tax=Triticum aestivum TaxID=4565 RepID=UPI001D01D5AC|nr:atherin-like isoform X1 [Triticum aestivum]
MNSPHGLFSSSSHLRFIFVVLPPSKRKKHVLDWQRANERASGRSLQVPSSDTTPDPLVVALARAAAADPLPHLPPSNANPSPHHDRHRPSWPPPPPPAAAAASAPAVAIAPRSSRGRRPHVPPRPLPCAPTTPSPAAAPQVHFAMSSSADHPAASRDPLFRQLHFTGTERAGGRRATRGAVAARGRRADPGTVSIDLAAGVAACSSASGVLLIQRRREKGLRERGNRGRKKKEKGRTQGERGSCRR